MEKTQLPTFAVSVAEAMMHRCGEMPPSSVGVALSGGADSVAMLLALTQAGYACTALHCNFSLRGAESDGDEEFCRRLCDDRGIRLLTVKFDTRRAQLPGESTEMACRRLRYEWFAKMKSELRLRCIAVAHHAEDQRETMMINLLRGSGPAGLAGMAWRRDCFVRPMLAMNRRDIEDYLNQVGTAYRTDSSNLSNDYRRNALRNVIIPEIHRYFPDADAGLANTAEAMKSSYALIDDFISLIISQSSNGDSIDISKAAAMSTDACPALWLTLRRLFAPGFSKSTVSAIINGCESSGLLFRSLSGEEFELSRGRLYRLPPEDGTEHEIDLTGTVTLPALISVADITPDEMTQGIKTADYAWFDCQRLMEGSPRFALRHWREGDRIRPFGMRGSRKLSDIFSDLKMTLGEKRRAWVLTRNGEIIWIPGIRNSALFSVTASTKSVKRLGFMRANI